MIWFRIIEFLIILLIGMGWANLIEKTKDEEFGDGVQWP